MQITFPEYGAAQIRALEIRFLKVAGIELGRFKSGIAKLGISLVPLRNEDILTVGLSGAQAGHSAIDEFNTGQRKPAGLHIRQIAAYQADVFPHYRTEPAVGQAHAYQPRCLYPKAAHALAFHSEAFNQTVGN
jgi:hypothetical protein